MTVLTESVYQFKHIKPTCVPIASNTTDRRKTTVQTCPPGSKIRACGILPSVSIYPTTLCICSVCTLEQRMSVSIYIPQNIARESVCTIQTIARVSLYNIEYCRNVSIYPRIMPESQYIPQNITRVSVYSQEYNQSVSV